MNYKNFLLIFAGYLLSLSLNAAQSSASMSTSASVTIKLPNSVENDRSIVDQQTNVRIKTKMNPATIETLVVTFGTAVANEILKTTSQFIDNKLQNSEQATYRVMHNGTFYIISIACIAGAVWIIVNGHWDSPFVFLLLAAGCSFLEAQNEFRPLLKRLFKRPQNSAEIQAAREKQTAEHKAS